MQDASSAIRRGTSGWIVLCFGRRSRTRVTPNINWHYRRCRISEIDKPSLKQKNLEAPSTELPTKTVKAVTQVNDAIEATAKNALEINYEKAASEAINKVKQDLATKEIEQRLKQEIDRQRFN